MIWQISTVDQALIAAFRAAGPVNQAVVDAHTTPFLRGQHPQVRLGIKRYYYLLVDNARITLTCLGMPLDAWQGGAFLLVGTREIIGEFAGNAHLVGRKGLQMKMQPLHWMTGQADRVFASGEALLAEISEQILDSRDIERTQRKIKEKYSW